MDFYDTPQYEALKDFWNEPDHVEGCAYGLPFYMQRNYSKAWCGYVGVPEHHPHFGLNYSAEVEVLNWESIKLGGQSPISLFIAASRESENNISLDVLYDAPGGLTWAANRKPSFRPDGYWWFGFDCQHYNDLSPKDVFQSFSDYPWNIFETGSAEGRTYRTADFVRRACFKLASQLSDHSSQFPETLYA